jgi:hypothetical protein
MKYAIHFMISGRISIAILISGMTCSCTTVLYRDWQESQFSPEKEFNVEVIGRQNDISNEPYFFPGKSIGEIAFSENTYQGFIFDNVLKGSDRTFFVLINYEKDDLLLRESKHLGQYEGDAQMHILPYNVGFRFDENEFAQYREKIERKSNVQPVLVFRAFCYESKAYVYVYKEGRLVNISRAKLDVDWVERSFVKFALSNIGYVVTVPIDILTFPVQYFFLKDGI